MSFHSSCFLISTAIGSGSTNSRANLLANPEFFFLALNVTIFDADFAAVGALQECRESRAASRFQCPPRPSGDELAIEIPDRQAISFDIQLGMIENRQRMQRIDVGNQMSAHAIGIDQLDHARFFDCLFA